MKPSVGPEESITQSKYAGLFGLFSADPRDRTSLSFTTEPLRGTETILFVEDEAFVREVTGEVLKSAGYRVLMAQSAAEASGVYDQCSGEVDLLLSDVVLPGEDGRSLANRLLSQNPNLQVLMVTGYAVQLGQRESACEIEVCLSKPFSSGALLRKVRQVLDGGKQGRHEQTSAHARLR